MFFYLRALLIKKGMVSRFTALLALLSALGAECKPDSCGQLVEYKGGEVSAGIGTKASLFFIVFMASIAFVAGVCVGLRLGTGTKIEKEIGTQTHKLERMSVRVHELTIESIKQRLRAKDLRMSGLKGELADRLDAEFWA